MADQSYYQVPDVVSRYYPTLVDDYIRAATAAARPVTTAPSWYDYLGHGIDQFTKGLAPYFQEEQKSRLAEESAYRIAERQAATQQAVKEREFQLQAMKDEAA